MFWDPFDWHVNAGRKTRSFVFNAPKLLLLLWQSGARTIALALSRALRLISEKVLQKAEPSRCVQRRQRRWTPTRPPEAAWRPTWPSWILSLVPRRIPKCPSYLRRSAPSRSRTNPRTPNCWVPRNRTRWEVLAWDDPCLQWIVQSSLCLWFWCVCSRFYSILWWPHDHTQIVCSFHAKDWAHCLLSLCRSWRCCRKKGSSWTCKLQVRYRLSWRWRKAALLASKWVIEQQFLVLFNQNAFHHSRMERHLDQRVQNRGESPFRATTSENGCHETSNWDFSSTPLLFQIFSKRTPMKQVLLDIIGGFGFYCLTNLNLLWSTWLHWQLLFTCALGSSLQSLCFVVLFVVMMVKFSVRVWNCLFCVTIRRSFVHCDVEAASRVLCWQLELPCCPP